MKKIVSMVLALIIAMVLAVPALATDSSPVNPPEYAAKEQLFNPFSSPDNYIKYLESFGEEYSTFLSQFKALSLDKQQVILNVLSNGGAFDVKLSETSVDDSSPIALASQRSVSYKAEFQLLGITFITIRLEGRFTYSGSTVKTVEYKNAYIEKNWIPLTGYERTSLDAYVSNGRFYASAAFTAYIGAKIGDNVIGVTPRTFYITLNCDGTSPVVGDGW